jgi:septal ring factor EnvC (AmiA/AmiB activator)
MAMALAAALAAMPLLADPPQNRDLDRVRSEIQSLRRRLDRMQKRTTTAEQELQAIDLQTSILTKELQVAVQVTRDLERQKEGIEQDVLRLNERIGRQQRYLASRLSALYRLGSLSYLRILLSLDQKRNPFEAAAMLSYLIHRDARAVTQFQNNRQRLAEQHTALALKQQEVQASRRTVSERTSALHRARRQKALLLTQLRAESDQSFQKLAELEEKARRLERLLQLLYEHAGSGQSPTARIDEFQGALAWPVEGTILEDFGPKRSTRFATVTVSNGLKIEAAPGTEVRSIYEGTVVFTQWFKGYGNLVIVDHGDRIFSLYGNTRNSAVNVGDKIPPGHVLGQVAENEEGGISGYLYFEIREDNKPVNPQSWLR